ncbi:Bridging integrator 2 [Channa argus]|uniref:Bridging integrator 2 n=1 Tax=Channa argus TaxID=215402 RepID=A0A6G1Q413_CHAAH|nr:Bridging integrator 2 [Channa argus]
MAESTSPKGNSGDFAKKLQRQLSRSKEKVLQKLGKTVETRDDQFEHCLQLFNDQQTDGNRMHKDLRNYINAVREMREASRRLSQSLFDVYETDWAGEEDLGAIVEEKIAKRGRKLVDYDSSRHHLEALQTAKKRDDIKISKAEEEVKHAHSVYEFINNELKDELAVLYDSRIGCYVAVFSAVSTLREIFYKEMSTLNVDLLNVMKDLQAQNPDKVFSLKGMQRYGSLKRRTLVSPRALKASFSEFHRNYSPKTAQRFSFRSPDKPRRSTLSRESSTLTVSPQSPPLDSATSDPRDLDVGQSQSPSHGTVHKDETAGAAATEPKSGEDNNQAEKEKVIKGESEPKPAAQSDNKEDGLKAPPSESSHELSNSCDSGSLELQLYAADNGPLHIEETEDSPGFLNIPKTNGLDNGGVSGLNSETKDMNIACKDAPAGKLGALDSKSTVV